MSRTTLKTFQEDAVRNAVALLGSTLDRITLLSGAEPSRRRELRNRLLSDAGSLLIEAPTGIGKTLMAAHTVGELCARRPMIWLWFAPFQSVVVQTAGVLEDEVENIRSRDIARDRALEELRPGDVFVSTWAAVAVSDTEMRRVRRPSEIAPSLDQLLHAARLRSWLVGAVVDEAHHSFRGATKAYEFYREVLDPDATILVTATPRDEDIELFKTSVHLGNLRRIRVPRSEGVQAGILKKGIKTAVFKAPEGVAALLDFKRTALAQAVAVHRRLKGLLEDRSRAGGPPMRPLLMVQVGSESGAEEEARSWLEGLGFRRDAIMTHTAKEPDPSLNAVQGDEEIEVLVFKMAVALGFDAPRAFTLVSFRSARDENFGIQIVGRLMRVDRRLQGVANLPEELSYGYVFLADRESQTGLLAAGDRINAIRAELARLDTGVDVAIADNGDLGIVAVEGGQPALFFGSQEDSGTPSAQGEGGPRTSGSRGADDPGPVYAERRGLWATWGFDIPSQNPAATRPSRAGVVAAERAPEDRPRLRRESDFPSRFARAEIEALHHDILAEVLDRFRWDDSVFNLAITDSQRILMEEREVFSGIVEAPTEIRAKLLKAELERRSQYALVQADRDGFLDKPRLYEGLLERLGREAGRRGLAGFDTEDDLRTALSRILALRPALLSDAVEESFARHTISREGAPLPLEFEPGDRTPAASRPKASRLNIYGIYPPDLNGWEFPFAELLDEDVSGTVTWWHRNPVRKPWSVLLPIPGQGFYYPDFIVGVAGRANRDSAILVEIKHQINDPEGNAAAKARARHPDYGPVLMLYRDDARGDWMTVTWDADRGINVPDRIFRIELLRSW